MSEQSRLEINWVNSAGGALGAVSSAVLLSTLGAAGTLLGAALGSLCITVGGAIYSHYLSVTKNRVAAQTLAARRGGRTRETVPSSGETGRHDLQGTFGDADDLDDLPPDDAVLDSAEEPQPAGRANLARRVLAGLPWRRILLLSGALFAISMLLIVVFELTTGRAVATYTGGTSSSDVGTSIPGWSGTNQSSTGGDGDERSPGEGEDGTVPQDQAPPADGEVPQEEQVPQEQAPEDGSQELPEEEAPEEVVPPEEEAPAAPAPAEEAPQEQAPPAEAPAAPAPEPAP